jgi:hypothetical protein
MLLAGFYLTPASAQEEPITEQGYEREELGVNPYTAPSIATIFNQLDELKPVPFDKLWRPLPASSVASREQKAMIFGVLIADGFLVVTAERRNLIEELGRALIREAKGLGVAERVMKHSASLTELGRRGDWMAVRKELITTQADVEQALIDLRDQKIAHMISLGGWLRGLEMSAVAVDTKFSAERAQILVQEDLLDYFEEELRTLPPAVSNDPIFVKIRTVFRGIDDIFKKSGKGKSGLQPNEVKAIRDQARDLNLAISSQAL